MDFRKCLVRSLLVLGLFVGWVGPAFGLDRGLDLNLSAQWEYNDNIFWNTDDAIDDVIYTLSGGLTFHNRTERADADLSGRVERLNYLDHEALDATDQFYTGKASYLFSPRWRSGVNAGFSQDSRPDRDVETTGLVLGTAERDRTDLGGFTTFYATENTSATLSYSYEDEAYDQGEFSDMIGYQAGLGVQHNWGSLFDNTFLSFNLNYGRYEYDTANIDIYSGTLGFEKHISELWRFFIAGGANYQETEFVSSGVTVLETDKRGSVGRVGLDYLGEYTRFGISGSKDLTPSSGFSGTTERTSLAMNWSRRLAQKSRVGLNLSYHLNEAEAGKLAAVDVDEETFSISPNLKIALFNDFYLIAKYTYSQVDNRIADTTTRRRYVVLQVAYNLTVLE
jgi:hypothetical protein